MLCRTAIAVLGITRNNAGRTALSAVIHSASCASETPAATETTDCRSGSISRRISRINASVSHGLTASITTAASRTAAALSVVVRTPGHCVRKRSSVASVRAVQTISSAWNFPLRTNPQAMALPMLPAPKIAIFIFNSF